MALLASASVYAQQPSDAFLNRQRALEEEVRQALDKELPADQKIDYDWGGWYSFYLLLYDDGVDSSRTFRRHDLRLWNSLSFDQGAHQIYARGKMHFDDFNTGDSFDGNDNDWIGPNLDRGFYQFDLRRAAKAYANERLDWNFNLKIGRDLATFGTGYAFSMPLDHLLLTAEFGDLEIAGLMGTSIRSTDNIDLSRPNGGRSKRNFWGTQIKYKGIQRHEPFIYAVWNEDQQREDIPQFIRDFDYDSYYLGLGSTGELATNLRYGTEFVFQGGHSYTDRIFPQRRDIQAWGADFSLEYTPRWAMQPRFVGEYMFASGDPHRTDSPTNTLSGSTSGRDTGFVGFGYRDTGLSLAPRLSNVHIWRAGASFKPFEDCEPLRNLELGTDWFLYAKNRAEGAISDSTADRQSGYVGWEMDYFINWRITSDLSWTTRFGTFFPGKSFSDQTTRTFLLTGVTYSF